MGKKKSKKKGKKKKVKIRRKIKKTRKPDSWKKKNWYTIISPKDFEEEEIGITPAFDEKKLTNRIIVVPLRNITNKISHQFVKLRFKIKNVKGKNAYTELVGFELTREYLRRNVRRRRSIIKVVRDLTTKDGKEIQLTIYTFTLRKIDTSKKDGIRKIMIEYLDDLAKSENLDSLVQKSIFGALPTEISKISKKIAPIRRVEVAKCKIRGEK